MSEIEIASIITTNHCDKAFTMLESMREFRDCHLHLFPVNLTNEELPEHEHVTFYRPEEILDGPLGTINRLCYARYHNPPRPLPKIISRFDYLRWSLKAGFIRHLLQDHQMIIYADCDLHFYSDFSEIINYATSKSITLSPHWRTIHTTTGKEIDFNFRHGLYNGGFLIATQSGNHILDWWAERCCAECSASSETTYVDQKYLDMLPLYFDNIGIIKHKGYNVAAWNLSYLKRTIQDDEVLVAGEKIVFIHYSPITVRKIEEGDDFLLADHLREYKSALLKQRTNLYRNKLQHLISEKEALEFIC